MALLRAMRQGLVAREEGSSPAIHFLTDRGMARMMFFHSRQPTVCSACGAVGSASDREHIHLGCGGVMRPA
jgi:hypothetical protein